MDDSNSQTFASEYFSHSQIIKITVILRVCERLFRALVSEKIHLRGLPFSCCRALHSSMFAQKAGGKQHVQVPPECLVDLKELVEKGLHHWKERLQL